MTRLSDMTCLITGANSGLGFAVSKKLAALNAHTILVCRNEEKGREAMTAIELEIPEAKLDLMLCDLASLESIQRLINDFQLNYSQLDLLFNNAAVMQRSRTMTGDGFEMMFQVNYLAPFILMNSLAGRLREGQLRQVMNNGRPGDDLRLDFDDLQFANDYQMYGSFFQTKLCLLIATLEFAHRHQASGLTVTMADPGAFKSNLVRDVPWIGWLKNLFSAPVDTAAENILFVLEKVAGEGKTGRVFEEREEKPLTPYWQDIEVRDRLWAYTESLLNINQPS